MAASCAAWVAPRSVVSRPTWSAVSPSASLRASRCCGVYSMTCIIGPIISCMAMGSSIMGCIGCAGCCAASGPASAISASRDLASIRHLLSCPEPSLPSLARATPRRDVAARDPDDPHSRAARRDHRGGEPSDRAGWLGRLATPDRAALWRELFPRHRTPHRCWDHSHPLWIPCAAPEHPPPRGGRVCDGGGHLPRGRGG